MSYTWNHDYPKIARDSGFKLRLIKDGELDWRLLGSIDIDNLVRNQNLERLDVLIGHVAEAPLAKILDTHILDSGVAKYFHLAQLSLQYLNFCKRFLDETLAGVRSTLHSLRAENIELKELNLENNDQLLKLHKKLQKIEDIHQIVFPCSMCSKNFVSNEMLDIHIKKKHANDNTMGKVSVTTDTNLINTIKLELEIKHLKERLNIAEKEIRDKNSSNTKTAAKTTEMKIDTGTTTNVQYHTTSSATQTSISTQDVGIQSNLEEPKETDDSEDSPRSQQQLTNEINERLSQFEEWKAKESLNTEHSINLIKGKVSEMLSSVDEKLQQIQVNDKVNVMPEAEIMAVQKTLADSLTKICNESQKKLESSITAFEFNYNTKLEGLEKLINRYEASIKAESKQMTKRTEKPIVNVQKIIRVQKIHANKDSSDENEYSEESSGAESDDDDDELTRTISNVVPLKDKKDINPQKTIVKPKITVKSTKQTVEIVPSIVKKQPEKFKMREAALNIFSKRLRYFGINSKTTSISNRKVEEITEKMIERSNSYRKKHPKYFVVRNKLKQTVEQLAQEKMKSLQSKEETDTIPRSDFDPQACSSILGSEKKETQTVADIHSISSSDNESTDEGKQNNENVTRVLPAHTIPLTVPQQSKDMDQFKTRLDKILASPIRRPTGQMRTLAPSQISVPGNSKPIDPPSSDGLRKPVPTPRKKVMFDLRNSDDESTSNETDIKTFKLDTKPLDELTAANRASGIHSETSSLSSLLN